MILNDKKREYLEKEIFSILDRLQVIETKDNPMDLRDDGSISHKIATDLTDKITDSPIIETTGHPNNIIEVKEIYKGKTTVINEDTCKDLKKIVSAIYKEKDIEPLISKDFIEKITKKWLFDTFRNKQVSINFTSYILDEIQKSLKEWKMHYPILHLDISKPFEIGKVRFDFFTKEYFDSLIEKFERENSGQENPYIKVREQYQGNVFATCTVKGEKNKAKEVGLEKCSLAVDILKMFSQTTHLPFYKLSFDIDCRVKENLKNEVIFTKCSQKDIFEIDVYRLPNHHQISEKEWQVMIGMQFQVFHQFLNSVEKEKSELILLILNGIRRYGNAISNINLHQRIVELFTILESLLLPNENSSIIESVCNYCSKLVFKKIEDRKHLIKLLKSMYKVRSSLIHHAKETSFDMDDLRKLQYTVIMLLAELIRKSEMHKTKLSILNEIDDAILNAY